MPTRLLRDWTDSESVETLRPNEEVFFVRLIMKADDFGRFHANPRLLRSLLFPLRDGVSDSDISLWTEACRHAGLIRVYAVDGRKYLEIQNFNQRTRAATSKFPTPDGESRSSASHVAVTRPSLDRHPRTETYSEAETEAESKTEPESEPKGVLPRDTSYPSEERDFVTPRRRPAYRAEHQKTEEKSPTMPSGDLFFDPVTRLRVKRSELKLMSPEEWLRLVPVETNAPQLSP